MEKMIMTAKLTNLCAALNACGIPAEVVMDSELGVVMSAALWNCNDGSGVRFDVCQDPGSPEGTILAYAQPVEMSYEELVDEEFED